MNLDLGNSYARHRYSDQDIESILLDHETPAAILVDQHMRIIDMHGNLFRLWHKPTPKLPCTIDALIDERFAIFVHQMIKGALSGEIATKQFEDIFVKAKRVGKSADNLVLITFRQLAQWYADTIPQKTAEKPKTDHLYYLQVDIDADNFVKSIHGTNSLQQTFANLLRGYRLTDTKAEYLGPNVPDDIAKVRLGSGPIVRRIGLKGTKYIRQIEKKNASISIFLTMDTTAAANELERQQFLMAHAELAKSYAMIGLGDNPTAALQSVCEYLHTMFADARVGIVLFDDKKDVGVLAAGTNWADGVVGQSRALGISRTELIAAQNSFTVIQADQSAERLIEPSNFWLSPADEHCFVCRIGHTNTARGAIVIYSRTLETIQPTQASAIEGMAAIASTALRTAQVQAELADNERHYRDLVGGLPVLVGITDENFTLLQVNDSFDELGVGPMDVGQINVSDIFGLETTALLRRDLFYNNSTTTSCEALVPILGIDEKYYLIQATRRQDGQPGYYIVALNIDERKKTEVLNKTISEELDHRVKNIIALINSIAFMTSQHSENIDDFLDTFEDRLSMLGRTHSILAGTKWSGATLNDIVTAEIAPFASVHSDRVNIDQSVFDLGVKGVQIIALIIHELTTNAIKYGALSAKNGVLDINWSKTDKDLIFNWIESGVDKVEPTEHTGAGTQVIKSTIERQLGGQIERSFASDGIIYRFTIPLEKISG